MEEVAILILTEFAKEAAESFGKEVADKFIDLVFGQLATKEDLAKAVLEIERYIDQAIAEIEKFSVNTNLASASTQLENFAGNKQKGIRGTHERSRIEDADRFAMIANDDLKTMIGSDYQGRFLVFHVRVATVHIAIASAMAAYFPESKTRKNLANLIARYTDQLTACVASIEDYEHETLGGDVTIDIEVIRNSIPDGDGGRTWADYGYKSQATIHTSSKRYGTIYVSGDWHNRYGSDGQLEKAKDDSIADAKAEAVSMVANENAAIEQRALARKLKIYDPVEDFCKKMKELDPYSQPNIPAISFSIKSLPAGVKPKLLALR